MGGTRLTTVIDH